MAKQFEDLEIIEGNPSILLVAPYRIKRRGGTWKAIDGQRSCRKIKR